MESFDSTKLSLYEILKNVTMEKFNYLIFNEDGFGMMAE